MSGPLEAYGSRPDPALSGVGIRGTEVRAVVRSGFQDPRVSDFTDGAATVAPIAHHSSRSRAIPSVRRGGGLSARNEKSEQRLAAPLVQCESAAGARDGFGFRRRTATVVRAGDGRLSGWAPSFRERRVTGRNR